MKFYNRENELARVAAIIRNEKAKRRIADLAGVNVHAVAAGSTDSNAFFAVQNFWMRYFPEAGATLLKEDYGSTLMRFGE